MRHRFRRTPLDWFLDAALYAAAIFGLIFLGYHIGALWRIWTGG